MAYTYPQVTVAGNDYNAYETLENADAYLAASIAASAWAASTDDDFHGKCLISSVRWLETLTYLGTKTDSANALAFPRSGISGVDENSIPSGVIYAYYEIAAGLAEDPTLFTSLADPGIRSMAAGPVNMSFFRPTLVFWDGPVPKAAMAYLAPYLAGSGNIGGPITSGTDCKTPVDDDFGFSRGI